MKARKMILRDMTQQESGRSRANSETPCLWVDTFRYKGTPEGMKLVIIDSVGNVRQVDPHEIKAPQSDIDSIHYL